MPTQGEIPSLPRQAFEHARIPTGSKSSASIVLIAQNGLKLDPLFLCVRLLTRPKDEDRTRVFSCFARASSTDRSIDVSVRVLAGRVDAAELGLAGLLRRHHQKGNLRNPFGALAPLGSAITHFGSSITPFRDPILHCTEGRPRRRGEFGAAYTAAKRPHSEQWATAQ